MSFDDIQQLLVGHGFLKGLIFGLLILGFFEFILNPKRTEKRQGRKKP